MEHKTKNIFIYGLRSIIEAIEAEQTINTVYIKEGLKGELSNKLIHMIRKMDIHSQYVPKQKLLSLGAKNHQGMVAEIAPVNYYELKELIPSILANTKTPLILILDRITDVRNFGAIARSAECAGADAIIIPIRNSVKITPDAVRTSAGSLYSLPVCRELNLKKTIKGLKKEGFQIVAADAKADKNYTEVNYNNPTVIIMGAEDKGIDEELLKFTDEQVSIPQKGKISSLNVAAATTVLLYESVRQRS